VHSAIGRCTPQVYTCSGETWNCRHATRRKPALGPVLPRCTGTTTRKVWPVPC